MDQVSFEYKLEKMHEILSSLGIEEEFEQLLDDYKVMKQFYISFYSNNKEVTLEEMEINCGKGVNY
jgi:hypothetical protein